VSSFYFYLYAVSEFICRIDFHIKLVNNLVSSGLP